MCSTSTLCLVSKCSKHSTGLTRLRMRLESPVVVVMGKKRQRLVAVPLEKAVKISAAKVFHKSFSSTSYPFYSGTRYHFAFENFDDTECSADLFFRNLDIWTMGDVCPAPKIWVPYTPPDYSTYEHQSLASYSRRKRNPDDTDKSKDVSHTSFDASYCKEKSLYSSENLLANKKHLNCCKVGKETFRTNAKAQGGGGKAGRTLYQSARETCCKESSITSEGTDALQGLCSYQKRRSQG